MSARLQKHFHLLHLLCHCNANQRNTILESLTHDQVLAICECIDNVLLGNVPIDEKAIKKLKRKRSVFAAIRDKESSLARKKDLIVQTGGFLPALLIPVLTAAAGFIGDLIIKKL